MNKLPLVSVVMPVYNGAAWVEESAKSILNQSFRDIELIVVDDGSTDATPFILRKLACTDNRLRIFTKKNSGIADSLNFGVRHSCGQWICRLDADDISELDRIEKQMALATATSDIVLIGSDMITIDVNGIPLKKYKYPTNHDQLLRSLLNGVKFFPHSSAFFRKDAYHSVGGYRSRICKAEDHDLWLRLSKVGKICSIPETLVQYRLHDAQVSYLDKGLRQAIDKTIAVISYYLRAAGCDDPVDRTDDEFNAFQSWVEGEYARLRNDDAFLLLARFSAAKQRNNFKGLIRIFAKEFLRDPSLCTSLALNRLGLVNFTKSAARKWIAEMN